MIGVRFFDVNSKEKTYLENYTVKNETWKRDWIGLHYCQMAIDLIGKNIG